MAVDRFVPFPLGPLTRGVIDAGNPALDLRGAIKSGKNVFMRGLGQLVSRNGTRTVLTFKDDQGTPANVTTVCWVGPFADGAVAIAHSTVTDKVYLYRLTADLSGWYDSTGALQSNATPQPAVVLWSVMTSAPEVLVAEGYNELFIAHAAAADSAALNWPTKKYTPPGTVATLQANLAGAGAQDVFFLGVISFQNHLWGWGFGSGTTPATGFQPEKARYSVASTFGTLNASDSITIGDRVRSKRERIIGAGTAGNALYLGGYRMISRVTGFGRNSWYRRVIDRSLGFTGPKCMVEVNGVLYFFSHMGPMRVEADGAIEPLYDPIVKQLLEVASPHEIVAAYEDATDLVHFIHRTAATGRVSAMASFDARRDIWLGPNSDIGLGVYCAGIVDPITDASSPPGPPAGDPTAGTAQDITTSSATLPWTNGDSSAQTEVEYKATADSTWIPLTTAPAGATSQGLTGLSANTQYHFRVRHKKNGQYSNYSTSANFTTAQTQLSPPGNFNLSKTGALQAQATWTNSGESASTEIEISQSETTGYYQYSVEDPGVASKIIDFPSNGIWWARARHKKSGFQDSTYTTPDSVLFL